MNESARVWARVIGFEAAVVTVVALGVAILIVGASGADANHAMTGPTAVTVELDELPPDMAANYRYAAEHQDELSAIPCYCGCDNMLGHRNLTDCYLTGTGRWDAHASGCAICEQETEIARAALQGGTPIDRVAEEIIARYGPPPRGFTVSSG